jgi:circadian clock protein KaiB
LATAPLRDRPDAQIADGIRESEEDVRKPPLAKGDQILAIPTVVRRLPKPVRAILGNLSDTERMLVGLDLRPAD